MTATTKKSNLPTILLVGALWGIFEATIGYALHLLPIRIGSYVWFPVAYFFMYKIYAATRRRQDVVWVALVAAAIKLLNLFTSVRVDYVINPAVSIVLEAFALAAVLGIAKFSESRKPMRLLSNILVVNTAWRIMYTLYIALLVPAWMRDVSVVQSAEAFIMFMLMQNLLSTVVCFAVTQSRVSLTRITKMNRLTQYIAAAALLCFNALLILV